MPPFATFILKEVYTTKRVIHRHRSSLTLRAWSHTNLKIKPLSLRDHHLLPDPHKRRVTQTLVGDCRSPRLSFEEMEITDHYVCDSRSWIVLLKDLQSPPPTDPEYLIDFAGFRALANYGLRPRLAIGVELVRIIALEHKYIIATNSSHHNQPAVPYLVRSAEQQRYASIAVEQIYATAATQRPLNYQQLMFPDGRINRVTLDTMWVWQRPLRWVYHDDEMLEILKGRYAVLATQ
jgi:hypothetical protein